MAPKKRNVATRGKGRKGGTGQDSYGDVTMNLTVLGRKETDLCLEEGQRTIVPKHECKRRFVYKKKTALQ